MYLDGQSGRRQSVFAEGRHGLQLLYLLIAIFALSVGIAGMVRVWREVGRPFGGFLWGWDPSTRRPAVVSQTPAHWPGPQHGVRGSDFILAVDGRDPRAFSTVYEAKGMGEEVSYLVERGGRQFTARVPISRFTAVEAFEAFGVMFLTGLSAVLAGYFLVQGAGNEPTLLIGFSLLTLGGAALYYTHNGGISNFYVNEPVTILLWIPCYPLTGALLFHLFLIFPQPLSISRTRLKYIPYGIAMLLMLLLITGRRVGGTVNELAFRGMLVFLTLATLAITARSLWAFALTTLNTRLRTDSRPRPEEFSGAGGVGVAFSVGLLLVLGFGVLPFFTSSLSTLVSNLIAPLLVLYPLLLLYAVKNAKLIQHLRHEIAVQEQLEAEAQELRGIRERTLHEVADALHDTVIADVRGLQLWLAGMWRRHHRREDSEGASIDSGELAFLEETLEKVYRDARRIMEGAKPVDFASEGLLAPLQRSLAHFRQANPGLEVCLETGSYDEDYPAIVKEEVYWIVQTALANSRDHAGARCITITLRKEMDTLHVVVGDDGAGFDVARALREGAAGERRRLGLRNMQMRAARIGAELAIESGEQGTEVRVEVALGKWLDG
jgi:signal transduction histidine kinase